MILIASTVAVYKCKHGHELGWLRSAEKLRQRTPNLEFFCAIQTGQGRDENFDPLRERMNEIGGTIWEFSFNDHETEVSSWKRINDICMGRNLGIEYAMRSGASHILFLDTDLYVKGDSLQKLLEIDHPLVGGNVPSYCLDGPPVKDGTIPANVDLREHWNTAGFLLIKREAFRVLRWRHDLENGMTDDPAFAADALDRGFGHTWVRHDVIGQHDPLVPVETRGYDLTISSD